MSKSTARCGEASQDGAQPWKAEAEGISPKTDVPLYGMRRIDPDYPWSYPDYVYPATHASSASAATPGSFRSSASVASGEAAGTGFIYSAITAQPNPIDLLAKELRKANREAYKRHTYVEGSYIGVVGRDHICSLKDPSLQNVNNSKPPFIPPHQEPQSPDPYIGVYVASTPMDTVVKIKRNAFRSPRQKAHPKEIESVTQVIDGVEQTRLVPPREKITEFSPKSRTRMKFASRSVSREMEVMLTLTYPGEFPTDGRKVKRDLRVFREALRRRYPDIGAFWFLEFQERGAPHFHAFLNGPVPKDWVATTWYRIVGSDDPRHLRAGTRIEKVRKKYALSLYATKYACKAGQKEVPADYSNVGRFWGFFGNRRVEGALQRFRANIETIYVGTIFGATALLRRLRKLEKSHGFRSRYKGWRGGLAISDCWSGGISWGCNLHLASYGL